jgi:hypothetical protein
MIDHQTECDKAKRCLEDIINDPLATPAERKKAEAALQEISLKYIFDQIRDIDARNQRFQDLINEMKGVIAKMSGSTLSGVKGLTSWIETGTQLINGAIRP